MATDDLAEGKEIQDEEKWTKHRTLGDTLGQGGYGGGAIVDGDELLSVREVRV